MAEQLVFDFTKPRPGVCTVTGCVRRVQARGLCGTHLQRFYRHGDLSSGFAAYDHRHPTLLDLFWSRTKKTDTCWIWTAARSSAGYGQLRYGGKIILIHRLSYELFIGPIPDGIFVCHKCDNPPCCRPDHLFLGTAFDNTKDCAQKGRTRNYEIGRGKNRGEHHPYHKLTEADVRAIRADPGSLSNIAKRFGMSVAAIHAIKQRRNWGWLPD